MDDLQLGLPVIDCEELRSLFLCGPLNKNFRPCKYCLRSNKSQAHFDLI